MSLDDLAAGDHYGSVEHIDPADFNRFQHDTINNVHRPSIDWQLELATQVVTDNPNVLLASVPFEDDAYTDLPQSDPRQKRWRRISEEQADTRRRIEILRSRRDIGDF